jgi:signal transduction histidine kinase
VAGVSRPRAWLERPSLIELGVIDDRDSARLAAVGLGGISLLGIVAVAVCFIVPPPAPRFHPLPVLVIALTGMAIASAFLRFPGLAPGRRLPPYIAAGTLTLGVLTYAVGPDLFPYVAIFFVWIGATFPFLSRRQAVAQLLLVYLVCALVIAMQPGHWNAFAEWEIVIGAGTIAAAVLEWVVQRITDVAFEQRTARRDLEEASDRLEQVNRQKREFLAVTSHELRTPLNAIIGFADILAERLYGPLNDRQAGYVEDIRSSGQHLLGLISEVLDVAKVESGALQLDVEAVDADALLAGIVTLFRDQAARAGVHLHLDAGAIGVAEGDERKLRQVLVNLVGNAVALTPEGGSVTVRAHATPATVHVAVADTGPGIAPLDRERIFEAYEQAARREGSTGLGLPLARRLIEAHGGHLDLETQLGQGSIFSFTLPRRHPRAATSAPASTVPVAEVPTPDELMRGTTRVATMFILGAAAVAGLAGIAATLAGTDLAAFQRAILFTGAVAVVSVIVLVRMERSLSVRGYVVLYLVLASTLDASVLLAGSRTGPIAVLAYTWGAVATFMVLPRRPAVRLLAVLLASYGVVVAVQPGNYLPALRWWLVAGACVGCAAAMSWLMSKLGVLIDAEHEAKRRVEASWAELDRVSRHKSEFLANMSHELRTPLNAIIGFADVLREQLFGPLNERQAEYVGDVIESGHQLLGLINDILDLAKAEAGRVDLHVEEFAADDLVRDALSPFSAEATRRGITLAVDVDPAATRVEADRARLGRALTNLTSNAVRVSPDGGCVEVRVRPVEGRVCIEVRDAGPGIAVSDQVRIFEEFERIAPPGVAGPGRGLGLALARSFTELHDGQLEVDSTLGQGSTFRITLPRPTGVSASP